MVNFFDPILSNKHYYKQNFCSSQNQHQSGGGRHRWTRSSHLRQDLQQMLMDRGHWAGWNPIWDQIRLPGAVRGRPGPQKGPSGLKWALLGALGVSQSSLKGPKHMIWMQPTQLDQPVALGPKNPLSLPFGRFGPRKGLRGARHQNVKVS